MFAGYGKFKGQVLNANDVECLYEGLKENNIHNFTHLLTGIIVFMVLVMVISATFNNISVISCRSVLLMEEIGVPGENHQPAISH